MSKRSRSALQLAESAVRTLATGEHGIRERLAAAYEQELQHIPISEVPGEIAHMLSSIYARCGHGQPLQAVRAVLDRMEPSAAMRLARDIFEFHCVLSQALYH